MNHNFKNSRDAINALLNEYDLFVSFGFNYFLAPWVLLSGTLLDWTLKLQNTVI